MDRHQLSGGLPCAGRSRGRTRGAASALATFYDREHSPQWPPYLLGAPTTKATGPSQPHGASWSPTLRPPIDSPSIRRPIRVRMNVERRHSLGELLVHLCDVLQRLPIFGVSARANASSDRLPEPVGSGPSIVVVFIRRLPSRGVALTHAIGPGAKRCSGSAETIPLRIETTRPTFGQTHLSDRQPDGAQPLSDRPAPAGSRDQTALSPLVTLL